MRPPAQSRQPSLRQPAPPERIGRARALALLIVLLAACGGSPAGPDTPATGPESVSGTVRIAAASDLQFAIPALIEAFTADYPNLEVTPTFGSSGNFFAQIQSGAPFDLYFSADFSYPERLAEDGLVAEDGLFEYAVGRVVVWTRQDSLLDVEGLGLNVLRDPAVRRISVANPEHAPYGVAAVESLRSFGVFDEVEDKLVLGENVSQAAQFIDSGAAEVGIIALSLALAPQAQGRQFLIPAGLHNQLLQGGAILSSAQDPEAARLFVDYLAGGEGKRILENFGFVLPPDAGR